MGSLFVFFRDLVNLRWMVVDSNLMGVFLIAVSKNHPLDAIIASAIVRIDSREQSSFIREEGLYIVAEHSTNLDTYPKADAQDKHRQHFPNPTSTETIPPPSRQLQLP